MRRSSALLNWWLQCPSAGRGADIEARSLLRVASPSLRAANLVDVARAINEGFAAGFDGAVVVQGTDTIEESAFLLDLRA